MSRFIKLVSALLLSVVTSVGYGGPNWASGQVTSLQAHGADPAIRLTNNVSPDLCDGGTYGWLYFAGTPEEKQRIYATAMTMAVTGVAVTVYTNTNGARCEINNIQITGGLN